MKLDLNTSFGLVESARYFEKVLKDVPDFILIRHEMLHCSEWWRLKKPNTVILICGLPGSGKTYLGNLLSKMLNIEFIDDITDTTKLDELLSKKLSCIVADPYLVFGKIRASAIEHISKLGATTQCIFLENNPEQCYINVKYRNDDRLVEDFIRFYSKHYNIPPDAEVIKIYQCAQIQP